MTNEERAALHEVAKALDATMQAVYDVASDAYLADLLHSASDARDALAILLRVTSTNEDEQ